jgi:glycogen debranching enzyme
MSSALIGENYNPNRRTIKNNKIFLVTNQDGDVIDDKISGFGLYTDDTRFLSRLELKINDTRPVVLSSSSESGHSAVIIATNIAIPNYDDLTNKISQETVQIKRESIIYGAYFETITITNYNTFNIGLKLELFFDSDFWDIFEIRNLAKISKNVQQNNINENDGYKYIYQDITGATLSTEIIFIEDKPVIVENGKAIFEIQINNCSKKELKYQINLKSTASLPEKLYAYDFNEAFEKVIIDNKNWELNSAKFMSSNEDFNEMVQRGIMDVNMLRTNTHYGEFLSAGIPWFSTLFGRDSLISSRQCLLLNPNIAKNTLETLSKLQGKKDDIEKEEEPGKILHEVRFGELARHNDIAHTYYGTIDATPLWLILLYDYFKWTNDKNTLENLWKNALDCLAWMDNNALMNNGYIAYKRRHPKGLENQGWKDSFNSNIHADGSFAEPPIALVEVQGYFYAAKIKFAELAGYMGANNLKMKLIKEAAEFKKKFHNDFWIEDLQFYAMGLDKDGNKMQVVSSNPGHCLETGLLDYNYANIIAERFFSANMFSGWGIRTLSTEINSYNPMSYHNGTIWPHDNSIIAYGLAKIGKPDLSNKIITSLFEAARLMRYKRLPELFCGFSRINNRQDPPVSYPVACRPQAWSAASVFLLIQSMLNIVPDAQNKELKIIEPQLPEWLDFLQIKNLQIGDAFLDLEFRKAQKNLGVVILEKRGTVDVLIKR